MIVGCPAMLNPKISQSEADLRLGILLSFRYQEKDCFLLVMLLQFSPEHLPFTRFGDTKLGQRDPVWVWLSALLLSVATLVQKWNVMKIRHVFHALPKLLDLYQPGKTVKFEWCEMEIGNLCPCRKLGMLDFPLWYHIQGIPFAFLKAVSMNIEWNFIGDFKMAPTTPKMGIFKEFQQYHSQILTFKRVLLKL